MAKDNDLDFVALNQGFKKLRTNITDFGHLSSNEITKLTVKLRKMRVSTDDAVSVFKACDDVSASKAWDAVSVSKACDAVSAFKACEEVTV